MHAIDIDKERESVDSSVSHDKSHESDADYKADQPGQEAKRSSGIRQESCCKKGWLSNLEHRDGVSKDKFDKAWFKDFYWQKATNTVHMQLVYFSMIPNPLEPRDFRIATRC